MPDEPVAAYRVVRAILSDDIDLPAGEAIARAKARGVNQPDDAIRHVVHNVRSDLRRGRRSKVGTKKPAVISAYTLAREALVDEPSLSTPDLVTRLKARGVTKSDSDIREIIRQTRNGLRRKAGTAAPTAVPKSIPAPAAAAVTVPPPAATPVAPVAVEAGASDPFAGVRLANKTAQACGGIAKAREIAEAIRAVGGIDAFLTRLDLVADILASETKL